MNLEQSVDAFKQKNVKAFEVLYKHYSNSIYGVINVIVKDSNIADEVTQDVFMKAWNNANSYDASKGRFFTWLLNIARNAAIDKTRSKAFKNSKKNLSTDNFVDIIASDENLDQKTDAIGIKQFLRKIPEKCLKIIEFIYFKGYTQKETAETLDIPIGTVKTRSRTCIQDLRKLVLR